jgi:hypothetical protein
VIEQEMATRLHSDLKCYQPAGSLPEILLWVNASKFLLGTLLAGEVKAARIASCWLNTCDARCYFVYFSVLFCVL